MAEKNKNLGLRGTPEQHLFLKTLSVKTGKTVQRLFEDAIRYSYDQGKDLTPPAVPATHSHAHALLEEILASGDKKAIDWITGNLRMFAEALEARTATRKAERKRGS